MLLDIIELMEIHTQTYNSALNNLRPTCFAHFARFAHFACFAHSACFAHFAHFANFARFALFAQN